MIKRTLPFFYQISANDCGLTCLKMICAYYGKQVSIQRLLDIAELENVGVSMSSIKSTATQLGLEADGVMLTKMADLREVSGLLPCIVHWKGNHFVVVYKVSTKSVWIADPAKGKLRMNFDTFYAKAYDNPSSAAHILLLEPTDAFKTLKSDPSDSGPKFSFVLDQLRSKSSYFSILILGLIAGMLTQFVLPLITKSVVDMGISAGDVQLIIYLLLGQLSLIFLRSFFDVLRSRLVMHLSARVNFSLVQGFLLKLFRLPIPFFESRKIGDILQRIRDHQRVELFITRYILSIISAVLSLVIFSIVLYIYNPTFFYCFLLSTVLYVIWITLFLEARKRIDWMKFDVQSQSQSILVQLVNGIQDLKTYNSFDFIFNKWEKNQHEYFNTNFKSLRLNQIQESGATLIYEVAQIAIIFYSARLVVNNQLTLGAMLSIQFIIGQLVSPIQQIIGSVMYGIEAKLSFDRIFHLWSAKEEGEATGDGAAASHESIYFRNVSFRHPGQEQGYTIKNLNLVIPKGKITAIVGSSGSGKTTILKLLLGYYTNYSGEILIGGKKLSDLDIKSWRSKLGVVLQDNYIFSDTIANNIALSDRVDHLLLQNALRIANIDQYVATLPLKHDTIIGEDGKGISQGQKQRLLIARAVYRDPDYLFLDEATNALDAENETTIMQNVLNYTQGKTVIIIAHRLSTIRDADNIIVFGNGKVIENGSHEELFKYQGAYHQLIKRQMTA